MKALIVDGEELFRLSLKEVVTVSGNFTDIIEITCEHDFLAKTAAHSDVSLVVLHPGTLRNEGSDWVKLVRRLYPAAAIVAITASDVQPDSNLEATIQVPRNASVGQMVAAIREALQLPVEACANYAKPKAPNLKPFLQNENRTGRNIPGSKHAATALPRLSYRQKQILAMAADGLPNKEIAARLGIAEGTVKAHMHAIFKVLGVTNRTQAVIHYTSVQTAYSPDELMPSNGSAAQVAF